MKGLLAPIGKLVNEFTKLPGVGYKTALRYAYEVINMTEEEAASLAEAILQAKKEIKYCNKCGALSETDICEICEKRSDSIICVVENPKDVLAIERLGEFKGQYHVLGGTISPMDGIGPDDLRIKELLQRIGTGTVKEVIMATNTDVEGETTAMYISKLLKPLDIVVTKIARGIPIGSDLEYADDVTLSKAFLGRTEF